MHAGALQVLVTSPRPIFRPSAAVARFVAGACDWKELKAQRGVKAHREGKLGVLFCSASGGMEGAEAGQGSAGGSNEDAVKTVRVVIKGKVQGVFYRKWTADKAELCGLRGWVRNRHDGNVEAVFSGMPQVVDEMVRRCRSGPPEAIVTGLEVEDWPHPVPNSFEVKTTAW